MNCGKCGRELVQVRMTARQAQLIAGALASGHLQDFKDGWSNLASQITDVRPLGSNLILVIGTWEALPPPAPATASATPSGQATSQPQSGTSQAPQKMHGLWSAVEQVQGTEVKIRNLTAN
jgi:hypothetical protein